MRFETAKLHLSPSPNFTNGSGGVLPLQPPTAEHPAILTEAGAGILDEQGNVIIE